MVGLRTIAKLRETVPLQELRADEVRELIAARRRRSLSKEVKVERRYRVVRSRPVLAGTRIPVDAIWNFHEAGYSIEQILDEYPTLTAKDVAAAIEYKSAMMTG